MRSRRARAVRRPARRRSRAPRPTRSQPGSPSTCRRTASPAPRAPRGRSCCRGRATTARRQRRAAATGVDVREVHDGAGDARRTGSPCASRHRAHLGALPRRGGLRATGSACARPTAPTNRSDATSGVVVIPVDDRDGEADAALARLEAAARARAPGAGSSCRRGQGRGARRALPRPARGADRPQAAQGRARCGSRVGRQVAAWSACAAAASTRRVLWTGAAAALRASTR